MILAGDIGGTHTRLALFSDDGTLIVKQIYNSLNYSQLSVIISDFLSRQGKLNLSLACFGIAGPIRDGICHATNLPWVVDAKELKEAFSLVNVFLINDLEANAWGIPLLKENELITLNAGSVKSGNAALISAGTGLGEAGLYWDGKSYHPFATEGGHCDFSPRGERESLLLIFLMKKFGHVSFERLLSGQSFLLFYEYLTTIEKLSPNQMLEKELQKEDPAKVITDYALNDKCSICVEIVNWFCSIYGHEAGNLALKLLPFSGVYLGGGIAPKLVRFLKNQIFMEAFIRKGRFSSLLSEIPVKLILNDLTALYGAMHYAQNKLNY